MVMLILYKLRTNGNVNFVQTRDSKQKLNPSLTSFEQLPLSEKKYIITLAFEALR